ncbi:alpha beta hydrolase [Levilactobacillus parabrevis ATCC 53295]|uniref:Alpha beta hydrolase n=1 Tax=Levilactobacillus parabrevis ATCC 53295 TaxID=1267003 RepID=A0A0R1GT48_9LACO|nr:alpha beta hydrolase [Levilactobacillus parabrevis ATCC 53295]KRO06785.1 alpha beta hydrolase [Levilactobacillus parabrevis]
MSRLAVAPQPLMRRRTDVTYSAVPTLLIPGWGGHAWTYNGLLRWLAQQGYGHKVLTVRVDWHGGLHFAGDWSVTATNPLIQVLFDHSLTRDYQPQVKWLTAILAALKARYGVTAYNAVAHSWGGSAAVHSLVLHGHRADLPQLRRLILLGAPVDEGKAGGPADMAYERLRAAQYRLPVTYQSAVINVYGTLSGRLTDGSVPVYQVTALRPILADSAVTYREVHVPETSHGQLHASRRMWRLIVRLIWGQIPK